MEEAKFLWESINDTNMGLVISLLWNFILTLCVVYLTAFANDAHKKIKQMYNHLEDDMEQEEIMNG